MHASLPNDDHPTAPTPPIVAGILIGGKSVRMGTTKAALPWGRLTMLETVVNTARLVTGECVLLGTPADAPPSLNRMRIVPDIHPDIGPIGGLHALLTHNPDTWCLLVSCDVPHITRRVLTRLVDGIAPNVSVVAYHANDRFETCCALYHASLLPALERAIAGGKRSLQRFVESVPHRAIPADNSTQRAVRNINTPQEYHPPAPD